MLGFVFGVLVGFGAKMAYDFFQEERIPTDLGMAQGRTEAIMDETRQIVREMREELRGLASSAQTSVMEKADRLPAATGSKTSKETGEVSPAAKSTSPAASDAEAANGAEGSPSGGAGRSRRGSRTGGSSGATAPAEGAGAS